LVKQIQTPPTTWSQLTKIVPYLTIKDGNNITQSAIALGTGANIERSYDILSSMMMQNGTQMASADQNSAAFNLATAEAGSATASTNSGLRALDFYLQFSNPNSSLYTWNARMPNNVEAFEQGQVAMIIHYADLYRFMITEAPSIKNSIDIQPLPQAVEPSSPLATDKIKTIARMNLEVATSARGDARRQQAAWNFIYYVTSKQGTGTYLSYMKLPSAIKDTTGKSKFQALTDQKGRADLWYKGIKAQDVNEIFIRMVEDAANGRKSGKEAIDQAAKDTSTILSGSKIKWISASQGSDGQ
jgi:ABC-type glycerol-3-phosphate transport system substrate-binding protein